jgi:fimbrial chaperone protein
MSMRAASIDSVLRALGPLLFAALIASAAHAGSFQVNPIRVDLTTAQASGAITVRNDGAEPVVVQASIVAWSQEDGRDAYAPSSEALVTPPIATIAPGAEQIVRVGLRRAPDRDRELTYRLFLQEVPPPPKPGFTGLQVALRIGVPVFVAPAQAAAKPLEWSATLMPDNRVRLVARNTGNVHHRISDFELRATGDDASSSPLAGQSTVAYVLAGQTREWTLEARVERVRFARELTLKAFTDAGEINAAVTLDR